MDNQIKLDSPGRRKVKYCPCNSDNRDGKFVPFKGYEEFGYCHGCNKTYHPPKDNISIKTPSIIRNKAKSTPPPQKTIIPDELVKANICDPYETNLIRWFLDEVRRDNDEFPFSMDQVRQIVTSYRLRGTDVYRGGSAFIYIDIFQKVRQIKIMGYDLKTGRRVKEPFPEIMQIGKKVAVEAGIKDVNIVPCFFGEHLLSGNNRNVYLFESEVTALYASVYFPDVICLATGGKNGCKWDMQEHFKVLKGREVTLWPDIDAHEEWIVKAETLRKSGINVLVSNAIVKAVNAQSDTSGLPYDYYRALKYDLRDLLIYKRPENTPVQTERTDSAQGNEAQEKLEKERQTSGAGISFEEFVLECIKEEPPPLESFETSEYRKWFDSTTQPNYPVEIEPGFIVYDAVSFVTGRLNHIEAFTGYRELGNRTLYIHQLEQYRRIVEGKQNS